jgi:uncharacterized protein DUF6879
VDEDLLDFWIIGDSIAVAMYCDEQGHFEGADVADPSELADHLRTRDVAWTATAAVCAVVDLTP